MPSRLRLYDLKLSRLPRVLVANGSDTPTIAGYVNAAQERLIKAKEFSDEGPNGTWAVMAFNVIPGFPATITCPREVARLEGIAACGKPIPIQNQFYEFLDFGPGPKPNGWAGSLQGLWPWRPPLGYSRNNAVTWNDLGPAPQYIVIYAANPADVQALKRVLIQGVDQNGNTVYSQDGNNNGDTVSGLFYTLAGPFASSPQQWSGLSGIQKDITAGPVQIFQLNPTTGQQVLLLTMEPSEQVAGYRRYYIDGLPTGCCVAPFNACLSASTPVVNQALLSFLQCNSTSFNAAAFNQCWQSAQQALGYYPLPMQVLALAKLDLLPVTTDTDYCLLTNQEAIIEECAAIRYSEMDNPAAAALAEARHKKAIQLLIGELTHFHGKNGQVAVAFLENERRSLAAANISMI